MLKNAEMGNCISNGSIKTALTLSTKVSTSKKSKQLCLIKYLINLIINFYKIH